MPKNPRPIGLASETSLDVGEAEVHDLHVAVILEEDILRLEIAMDDPATVDLLEGPGDLEGDAPDETVLEDAPVLDHLLQGLPPDVFLDRKWRDRSASRSVPTW